MAAKQGKLVSCWTKENGMHMHTRRSPDDGTNDQLPIWCVHGLSVSSRYMVPTARVLAQSHSVVAPDLPGFGLSAKPPVVLDVPALAEALIRRMDAFNTHRAVMLGNSMGCQIIAHAALRYPERVAAAVFVGPTFDPAALSVVVQAWRLFRDGWHESLASIVTQASDYIRCGPRRTLATLRYGLADPFEAKLPKMSMPVLVVRGEHDPIAPRPWCEHVTRLLPNAELVEIPGAPHALNYDAPEALAAATLTFITKHAKTISPPKARKTPTVIYSATPSAFSAVNLERGHE